MVGVCSGGERMVRDCGGSGGVCGQWRGAVTSAMITVCIKHLALPKVVLVVGVLVDCPLIASGKLCGEELTNTSSGPVGTALPIGDEEATHLLHSNVTVYQERVPYLGRSGSKGSTTSPWHTRLSSLAQSLLSGSHLLDKHVGSKRAARRSLPAYLKRIRSPAHTSRMG